jgi:allophanate hydrolase
MPGFDITAGPVALAEQALARIAVWNDPALFITAVPAEQVLARAAALAGEGPQGRSLYGLPFVVKDNIDVAGLPTTAACPAYAYTPKESAPAVQRLLAAGAILLGKVNLDQFATGLVGVRSPYSVPRNALNARLVPGGSSSGSATAVAAGVAAFSLGTDTAGSGRVPAAANNIVGLKPSLGLVPTRGVVPACRSLDCISVFAPSVVQAARVLAVIAGPDAEDRYSCAAPPHWSAVPAPQPCWSLAVPLDSQLLFDTSDDEALYRATLEKAVALGASIAQVDIAPLLAIARRLYDGAWVAERTAGLREVLLEKPEAIHPVTRRILEAGFDKRTVDAWDDFHTAAESRRLARALFAAADALLLPTVPGVPTLAMLEAEPVAANSRLGAYTNFVNICDLAALAVPAGFRGDGVPVGITLVGPAFAEARLAGLGAALMGEAIAPPALRPDELPLFCIGAHMAGLPLNPQLLRHGGRFVREARTAPLYRMHDLGPRPGLVRVAQGGMSLAGEVWAVPAAALGAFLAEIPPPLGFGRVTLEDAETPLGFLCEAAGVGAAPDIAPSTSWREHLQRRGTR